MSGDLRERLKAGKSREILSSFIMEARKGRRGKKGNGDSAKRSKFLSAIMPQLAGDAGKAMADAIEAKDLEKFKTTKLNLII
jgi:hypothetical protein